jgi:hypothetical protein
MSASQKYGRVCKKYFKGKAHRNYAGDLYY